MKITDLSLTIEEGSDDLPHALDPVVEINHPRATRGGRARDAKAGCWGRTWAPMPMRALHFIPQGKGIDQVPLDVLVGPARVLNFTSL